jgi:hypothetical protein
LFAVTPLKEYVILRFITGGILPSIQWFIMICFI